MKKNRKRYKRRPRARYPVYADGGSHLAEDQRPALDTPSHTIPLGCRGGLICLSPLPPLSFSLFVVTSVYVRASVCECACVSTAVCGDDNPLRPYSTNGVLKLGPGSGSTRKSNRKSPKIRHRNNVTVTRFKGKCTGF